MDHDRTPEGDGFPRLRWCGDSALTIEFGETIASELNQRVLDLERKLAAQARPGMKAARHIGAGDERQHRAIVAHAPGAEAFAQIAIEIDVSDHATSYFGNRSWTWKRNCQSAELSGRIAL